MRPVDPARPPRPQDPPKSPVDTPRSSQTPQTPQTPGSSKSPVDPPKIQPDPPDPRIPGSSKILGRPEIGGGQCDRTQVPEVQSRRNPYAQYQSSYRDRGINLKHFGALRYVVQRDGIFYQGLPYNNGRGGASASNLNIADAPTVNCLIAGFYNRLASKQEEIQQELSLLPIQPKGRPKAGEIRDTKNTEDKSRLKRELKNVTERTDDLLAINDRVKLSGGIKHTDIHAMKEIVQLSGANSLTRISPLYPKFGAYLHIDNPNPITGKVHGVIKTPIKMLLATPTHVEAFTAATLGFITTSTDVIKLDVAEMTAKYEEHQSDPTLITYPSSSHSCPQRILRSDGTVYALETPFNVWVNLKNLKDRRSSSLVMM
ncbi:hypothetical protein T492DRAFT_849850 [Pavlovales sp. CCMP2436]|nr:hypothetical protein T492DRAFT_849850 [Pavlovales sp. CCMP2436]